MMFVSHKQFQHGRVWCQDNSRIISHCRTSMWAAKKIKTLLSLAPISVSVLVIVSHNVLDCFLKPDHQQFHYVVTSTQMS